MTDREKQRELIRAMRETLKAGVATVSAPGLFPTPDALADEMVEALGLFDGCSVLEPSAGTGALLRAVGRSRYRPSIVDVVEIVPSLAQRDMPQVADVMAVTRADFLTCDPERFGRVDRVLMNPPFANGSDIRHIRHALRFLKPGGMLVALCADGPRQRLALADADWLDHLPGGTFAGTGVRAAMIRLRGPGSAALGSCVGSKAPAPR